ncbi:hypothetical protein SEA_AMOHNITION_59 [Mycobacterium phage Amohnition]|uniref:Uncharacterized protein n=1 Tax=Mycobacterium phage Amohnition TaxID=2015874 RepID=A0A222ZPL8_9CAUD|nr:hypothetical protein I5G85_gp40 [Mycobacterium phage Amohnition]ASR86339.1 hypothetical protein SEA_AMOHNITION_59 [Mycobacterium phage Amohnition]
MSGGNFVLVGLIDVALGKKVVGLAVKGKVVVGVRADLGQVIVSLDGATGAPLPPLTVDQAQRFATLVAQAATKAGELAAAYRTYQQTLSEAARQFDEAAAAAGLGGH